MSDTTAEAPAPLNIYQRINEVRKAVKYVQKDARVDGKYNAVTHDAVTSWSRKELIEHGVIVVPNLVWSRVVDTGTTTKSGAPVIRFEGRYQIAFVNIDDPKDQVCMMSSAHALDNGDKAPGKAVSYATKYALLKVLSIETGENEESRADQRKRESEPDPEGKRVLEACTTVEQLAAKWKSLSTKQRATLTDVKNEMKAKLAGAKNETGN